MFICAYTSRKANLAVLFQKIKGQPPAVLNVLCLPEVVQLNVAAHIADLVNSVVGCNRTV